MKGFKKDGKFRPTEKRTKSALKKKDVDDWHYNHTLKPMPFQNRKVRSKVSYAYNPDNNDQIDQDRLDGNRQFMGVHLDKPRSTDEFAEDFYMGEMSGHPQEWVMILSGDGYEIDNENLGSTVYVEWEGLSKKDKDTITQWVTDDKYEYEIYQNEDRQIRKIMAEKLAEEIQNALGMNVDSSDIIIGTTGLTDEENYPLSTHLIFSADELDADSFKKLEQAGFEIEKSSIGVNTVNFSLNKVF